MPDDQFWGMQNVVVELQVPFTHGADPGQSLFLLHEHSPCGILHVDVPVQTPLLGVQAGARAQFPGSGNDGGVEVGPGPFCPMKIACAQEFVKVYVYVFGKSVHVKPLAAARPWLATMRRTRASTIGGPLRANAMAASSFVHIIRADSTGSSGACAS
jgi:hypothetical protein